MFKKWAIVSFFLYFTSGEHISESIAVLFALDNVFWWGLIL